MAWKTRDATPAENARLQRAAVEYMRDEDVRGLLRFASSIGASDFKTTGYEVLAHGDRHHRTKRQRLMGFVNYLEGATGIEFTLSPARERRNEYKKMTQKQCLTLNDAREIARCQQLAKKPWHRRLFGL